VGHRMIQVGTGGFGTHWCQRILPGKISDGTIEVVAAVDKDPEALKNARTFLGLPADRCFTSYRDAFERHDADFCAIVVPPAHHEAVVDAALEHDLHILSEKPIADSLDASVRIAGKVARAGKRMGITMSHSHDQDKVSFQTIVREHGQLDYIVCRVTNDARVFGAWGRYRHEMADPLLNETAYHHLDIVSSLAAARCKTVFAKTWNPPWGEFAGDSQGFVTLEFENGVHATYEGAMSNAVGLNGSPTMYLRAECRDATIVLNHREIRRHRHDPTQSFRTARELDGEPLAMLDRPSWTHEWLIDQFLAWIDGGEPMSTGVENNLQTAAVVFSAIESSRTGQPVDVQDFLRQARRRVAASDRAP
jgi:predicted dehydrogenase